MWNSSREAITAELSHSQRASVQLERILRFDLRLVELNIEARPGGQRDMRSLRNQGIALEVIVVPHLQDEVFAQGEGHGGLAGDDVDRGAQTVTVRNHGDVVQRGDGTDLDQLRGSSTPLRIGLHY